MNWFSRLILRRAGLIALLGTLLTGWGTYYSVQLYKNLKTEIRELLPTTARSVLDLHEVSLRLESIDNLAILIFSKKVHDSKRFVIDLSKKLEKVSPTIIASIDYRIDQELKFFKERQALFMDYLDLVKIRDYVRNRITYEKELYNPLNIFNDKDLIEPKLDFLALKNKYQGKIAEYDRLPGGFYASPDETKRVILVNLPGGATGIESAHRLKNTVQETILSLRPETYASDLEIKYTGGVEDTIEEQEALVADLELSTIIVTLIVTLGMLLFYRNILATFILLISLFMGTLWTFGISYFIVGYLNANSAFLGSIVIGNGINFGIIYLARYLEERRKNYSHLRATRIAMLHTATSTWTAALAAGLSYGSLMLTEFRGFNQFGLIGLVGMILCWISAFTVLPALLTVFDKITGLIKIQKKLPRAYLSHSIAYLVGRFPRIITAISIVITLMSLFSFSKLNSGILETDLSQLRNKESMTRGSAYLGKYLDEIFQRYLSPLVILPKSRENADRIAQLLREHKAREGKKSLIASVQTLDDFIPKKQFEKIKILKEIQKLLPPKLFYRLSENDQKLFHLYFTSESLKTFGQKDLPPLILRKFTEKDGTIGKMVLVEPPLTNDTQKANNLMHFIGELRTIADSVEPGAPVAGTMAISSDMIEAISRDGPKATLFAFIAVVILVICLFRNFKTIALILFSLFLGVIWFSGLILGFDLKINFLNFIALPITFGIGVDYGVNIFQRYRELESENILYVIKSTGGAVGLCSFSTIVGYGSLLLAGNQGFVSFGTLAVAGEIACVIAAVISLPAYLHSQKLNRTRLTTLR